MYGFELFNFKTKFNAVTMDIFKIETLKSFVKNDFTIFFRISLIFY